MKHSHRTLTLLLHPPIAVAHFSIRCELPLLIHEATLRRLQFFFFWQLFDGLHDRDDSRSAKFCIVGLIVQFHKCGDWGLGIVEW